MLSVEPDGVVYPLLYGLPLATTRRILAGGSGVRGGGAEGKGETCEARSDRPRNYLHHGGHAAEVRPRRLGGGGLGAEADGCWAGDARLRPRHREGEHNGPHRGVDRSRRPRGRSVGPLARRADGRLLPGRGRFRRRGRLRRVRRRRRRLERSEEHTSELQSPDQLVCRLLLEKKKKKKHKPRQQKQNTNEQE